jgi:hypothetical protein
MSTRAIIVVSALALTAVGCSGQEEAGSPDANWAGTVTTEGSVTTVVNESGSVWGGKGRLVEVSAIGVEAGPDEYMLGYINSMFANDERIVLLDEQADTVRVYDRAGRFLFDVGAQGQGPGEFTTPMILTMDAAGRIYVLDMAARRLSEFDPAGDFVTSLQIMDFGCCAWNMMPQPGGLLSVPIEEFNRETRESRHGVQLYSMEGAAGEPLWVPDIQFERATMTFDGREVSTPFSPRVYWYPTPDGGIVAGATDRYRFVVLHPDGSRFVVHHHAQPAPVDPDEWEWNREYRVAVYRQRQEGFTWDGAEMPRHHPAFTSMSVSHSGEIWVGRTIGSKRVPDCSENPLEDYAGELSIERCFEQVYTIDVFGADGRFLGEVEIPDDMSPYGLWIDGATVISGFNEDELGVVRVKTFNLEPPDGGS